MISTLFLKTQHLATNMELPLSPLPPFLALPGEPPIPWPHWYESFQTFVAAIGLTNALDARLKVRQTHAVFEEETI